MKISIIILLSIFSFSVAADKSQYQCKIKSVLSLNDNGNIVTHGWSANYLNREFTMDVTSGKVISSTALKVRLSNFDKQNQPLVLSGPNYRSITIFEDKNNYAAIEIQVNEEGKSMPYFYRTNVGMMLTGTCVQR